jgi:hypothetical protein
MSSAPALQVLRTVVVAVPAMLIVLFAGLVAALALAMDRERRDYALDFARVCTDLAAVLVNGNYPKAMPGRKQPRSAVGDR